MITRTITVNDAGDPEEIAATSVCKRIIIAEDGSVANFPTTDWILRAPYIDSDPVRKGIGYSYVFEKPNGSFFHPGDVAGYVELPSGSTTFQVVED